MKKISKMFNVKSFILGFLQKLYLSISIFLENGLFNHAAAAAYYFLLSIIPLLLLFIYFFNTYLNNYPEFSQNFFNLLSSFNQNLNRELLERIEVINVANNTIGILGVLNLLWMSRFIMGSIQRAFGVIFPAKGSRGYFMSNVIPFVIVPVIFSLILISVIASVAGEYVGFIASKLYITRTIINYVLYIAGFLMPLLITFGICFVGYRFLPEVKPSSESALKGAIGGTIAIYVLRLIFSNFFSITKYNLFYGIIGSIIFMLIWVYFVFSLFFLFAQFTYVLDNIYVLMLGKIFKYGIKEKFEGGPIERRLFDNSETFLGKYSKKIETGEVLFRQGEKNKNIYFIYKGEIGIYREGRESAITILSDGEVFGEMAYLLGEPRSATAQAESESVVLIIKKEIFDKIIETNSIISRTIIENLSERLKKSNVASKRSRDMA
jgi:membrane protein